MSRAPVGLFSALVPGASLFGSLVTWAIAASTILGLAASIYWYGHDAGATAVSQANARMLIALNWRADESDRRWAADEAILHQHRELRTGDAVSKAGAACIPTHEEITRINAILGGK